MTLSFDRQGGTYGSFSLLNRALLSDYQGGGYGYLLLEGRTWRLLRLHVDDYNYR